MVTRVQGTLTVDKPNHPHTVHSQQQLKMDHHFKLRYFPVRGRCEPILLVLEDAALSYSLDEVKLEQWTEAKKSGTVNPPFTPFQGLPVLEVYNVSSPTSPTIILGETPTILRFLDDHIAHRRLAAGCRRLSAVVCFFFSIVHYKTFF